MRFPRAAATLGAALAVVLVLAAAAPAQDRQNPIESYTCFGAQMERGQTVVLDINIFRWSTDEERERLLTTLQEFGRDKLIDELMKIRPVVGYLRAPNSIGYDLYYARKTPTSDGGQQIVLATNRRVAIREAATAQRSMQYQLTVVELHIDKAGKGEGKMVPAAKISWDAKKKAIEIENYRALPIDLVNCKAKTP
jgi:hypothetical protein